MAVTWIVFRLLSAAVGGIFRALDRYAGARDGPRALGWVRRSLALLGAAVLDLLIIGLSWLAGYGVALFVIGDTGSMRIQESLYLNAFLLVELIRVALRVLLSGRGENPRDPIAAMDRIEAKDSPL